MDFIFQIANEVRKDPKSVEQIEKNTREQAIKGEMSNVVKQGVVNAMSNQNTNVIMVLKDAANMGNLIGIAYDLVKYGTEPKLSELFAKLGL